VLTAFYMVRMWKLVFLGGPRADAAAHAHEGSVTLVGPLIVLALLAVVGGYRSLYPHAFAGIIGLVPEAEGAAHATILAVSLGVLILGAGAAWTFYAWTRRIRWRCVYRECSGP